MHLFLGGIDMRKLLPRVHCNSLIGLHNALMGTDLFVLTALGIQVFHLAIRMETKQLKFDSDHAAAAGFLSL